jgi:transposase, IS30 family
MYLRSDSAAGVRFLSAVQEGRGLKPSARAAGVGKATGYRWLREAFLALRDSGCSVEDAQAELGYFSALALVWDQQRLTAPSRRRHHLAVDQTTEDEFWRSFLGGDTLDLGRTRRVPPPDPCPAVPGSLADATGYPRGPRLSKQVR